MYSRRIVYALLFAAFLVSAQEPPPGIVVTGAIPTPLTLTAADLAKFPRASIKHSSHGVETSYDGVWLSEILKLAGAPQGSTLRGKALAGYVLASAPDRSECCLSSKSCN